jgi:signal transduction histidine kinase/CheY-like chemotaxis protein/HPt (histidine-containing phosphotransfer) domain-containing protein
MSYHTLLEKQIRKLLTGEHLQDDTIQHFLEAVNNAYSYFERDKKISEQAFVVSEKGYRELTIRLRQQNDIRYQSIVKLKNAICLLDHTGTVDFGESANNLAKVVSFLEEQVQKTKELETELIHAKEVAENAVKAKSIFLANMSHEIRTPLNGIIGMTEMVLETDLTVVQKRHLNIVKSSSETLAGLINDILDFSKMEAGRLELSPVAFSLQNEIAKSMQVFALKASEKKLELIFRVEQNVPDLLIGDIMRLRQVINNLLSNAIKFTEKGEIILRLQLQSIIKKRAILQFTVTDTGIGIPRARLSAIFEEFTQADNSISRKYGGTGLGLAISKRLVEMMGGAIWAESIKGKGSAFHFTIQLPLQAKDSQLSSSSDYGLKDTRVLVVEGNKSARDFACEVLKYSDMKPGAVANGKEALSELRNGLRQQMPYSLVLLNTELPGNINGFDVAEAIKKDTGLRGIDIIMVYMSQRAGDRERFMRLGITEFLSKPFTQSDVVDSIRNVLAKQNPIHGGADLYCSLVKTPVEGTSVSKRTVRILLVEDNLVNQEVALSMLASHQYNISVANNGEGAVAAIGKECFDVILMDVQMPVMNGYEATRKIRKIEKKNGKHTHIIGLTANAMNGDRDKCINAGMDDYISKPVHRADLLNAVKRATYKKVCVLADNGQNNVPAGYGADDGVLFEKLGRNKQKMERFLGLFKAELPGLLTQAETALKDKNAKKLQQACHGLRGMLQAMEMKTRADIAFQIEIIAGKKRFTEAANLLSVLKTEMTQAINYIENISK